MNTSTKILLALLMPACLVTTNLKAQNTFPSSGSAGIGTTLPKASAALELVSTSKGLLISRMTLVQRNAIVSPAIGLLIYQTNNTPGFYYYNGTAWAAISSKAQGWALAGNAGTNSATSFLGTLDAQPLQFKVNNAKAGWLDYNAATANTGFGFQSLNSTTGHSNSAFGYQSLFNNITGIANMAIGAYALYSNTGDYNVANGFKALYSNTGGYANTATGFQTLLNNTGGILNTGTGSEALFANTTGSYNTATGYQSLFSNTTGANNTATGLDALHYNTTGASNTATGRDALRNNTTGNENTANGYLALYSNTTGYGNTANGFHSLYSNTSGDYNTATGRFALNSNITGIQNTGNGFLALANNTAGNANTASGYAALISNTSGINNTANGAFSLYSNTTGNYNTANGNLALNTNTTGVGNTANGYQSLRYNTTGSTNTSNGTNTLFSNTSGYGNTASGYEALYSNTSGNYNTISGYYAGHNDNGAFYNTEIGTQAGNGVANGDGNTYVGHNAGPLVPGISNSGAFGENATPLGSNVIRIGSTTITSIGGQVGWTTFSDGRFKKNNHENVPGLDFIKQLHPITYNLDISGLNKKIGVDKKLSTMEAKSRSAQDAAVAQQEKITYTGFVAQDVEKAAKKLGYDFSGVDVPKNDNDLYGLRYSDFVVPLVKAVQELSSQNDNLKTDNANLKSTLTDVTDQLSDIRKQLAALTITQQNCCSNAVTASQQISSIQHSTSNISSDAAHLEQNSSNPFTSSTVIRYYVPVKTNNAQLMISDVSGHVLKTIELSNKGNGQATVTADGLSAGNYFYTLMVNGKKAATRQMVLAR